MRPILSPVFQVFLLVCSLQLFGESYFIPTGEISKIRQRPERVLESYHTYKISFLSLLGGSFSYLTDPELFVLYCSLVAHGMASYGYSNAIEFNKLLNEPFLNCGNYPILTMKLAEAGMPDIYKHVHVPFVAWRGPAFGYHGALFLIRSDRRDVFIDPTFSIIAQGSFDDIVGGRPVPASGIKTFVLREELSGARNYVCDTVRLGRGRPSELYYYYHSVDARNRSLPCDERTAAPRAQMELFGPWDYCWH